MVQAGHRPTHPPLEAPIAAAMVVVVILVVVSLAALIGAASSVPPIGPTFPDPVDRPLLVLGPAGLDLDVARLA